MNEGRTARPVGRVLRLLAGAALVFVSGRAMTSAESMLNLQVTGVILGLLVFYAAVHLAIARFVPFGMIIVLSNGAPKMTSPSSVMLKFSVTVALPSEIPAT